MFTACIKLKRKKINFQLHKKPERERTHDDDYRKDTFDSFVSWSAGIWASYVVSLFFSVLFYGSKRFQWVYLWIGKTIKNASCGYSEIRADGMVCVCKVGMKFAGIYETVIVGSSYLEKLIDFH